MPRVSVIMPVYLRQQYLRQALESALAQTYRDIEIIVTDNGPSPEIERLVRSYGDPRLRYRHNGTTNAAFADGHCKAMIKGRIDWYANVYVRGVHPVPF